MRTLLPIFTLAAGALAAEVTKPGEVPHMYTKEGQAEWGGECQTSVKQSPIDVVENGHWESWDDDTFGAGWTANVHKWLSSFAKGNKPLDMKMADIGPSSHAIKFTPDVEPEFCQDGACIKLAQWHYHIMDSEHAWNNELAFAEVHYVTYRSDKFKDLMDAVNGKMEDGSRGGNLRVFGYFIQPGDDRISYGADDHFKQAGGMMEKFNFGEKADSVPVNTVVAESISNGFARYEGGLTTPTCNELVTWTVFKDPVKINGLLAKGVAAVPMNLQHNNRMVQPVNDRKVRFFMDPKFMPTVAEGDDHKDHDHKEEDHKEHEEDNHKEHMEFHLLNHDDGHINFWYEKDQYCVETKKGGKTISVNHCMGIKRQSYEISRSGLQIQQGKKCMEVENFSDDADRKIEYPIVMKKCASRKQFNWDQAFTYSQEKGCMMAFNDNDWCVTYNDDRNLVLKPCMTLDGRQAGWFGHLDDHE